MDEQLILKKYYEEVLGSLQESPIKQLGEMFLHEQQDDLSMLSSIRFAQGEVYFENLDYEAAIYKWERVEGDLEGWARKNIADAYTNLQLYETAEVIYKGIETERAVLKLEIWLKLFALYQLQTNFSEASDVIKEAVSFAPDYPNVTRLAREFFELHGDWNSAIQLAVEESIRTEEVAWFETLLLYVERGLVKETAPDYFAQSLALLYKLNISKFEDLAVSFWRNYKHTDHYFTWLDVINSIIAEEEWVNRDALYKLAMQFEETYVTLLEGEYLVKELEPLIPSILMNWLKIANAKQAVFAASSVISWNDIFANKVPFMVVEEAENILRVTGKQQNGLKWCEQLFNHITNWADRNGLGLSPRLKWMVQELFNVGSYRVLLAGSVGNGKTTFLETVIGSELGFVDANMTISVQDSDDTSLALLGEERVEVEDISEFEGRHEGVLDIRLPNYFLKEQEVRFIEMPSFQGEKSITKETEQLIQSCDGILFVLDARAPVTRIERDILLDIHDLVPQLPIHFLLNKMDTIYDNQIAVRMEDETRDKVKLDFPNAKVLAYSKNFDQTELFLDLKDFMNVNYRNTQWQKRRIEKVLFFIRQTLSYLLEKRIENERKLEESIAWNQDMMIKLNGAQNQLTDIEQESAELIKQKYYDMETSIKEKIQANIPKILRECANKLSEDSDFSQIHLVLNEEMNSAIQTYANDIILPEYDRLMHDWIGQASLEFGRNQQFMEEMSESFNELYQEQRLTLLGDFKLIDDWKRDATRLTSYIHLDKVNILLRRTPSQLLLKGASKLFKALPQNKTTMYNQYKKYLDGEDFNEVAETVSERFFAQFKLFEQSLGRDITLFFKTAHYTLEATIEDMQQETNNQQAHLVQMRERPELYRDPITLFDVKLRQLEILERL